MIAFYWFIAIASAYLIHAGMVHLYNAHRNRLLLEDAEARRRHEVTMGVYEEQEDDDEDEE
jgi:hypothetical protein